MIAVGVAATLLVTGLSGQHSATYLDLFGFALLAAGGLGLVARRRAPVLVLAVTGLCAVGYQAAGFDVPAVAYLFAVYAAVRAGHRTVTVVASVTMLAVLPSRPWPRACTTRARRSRRRGAPSNWPG
ncbi:hypothetical protein ACFQX6_09595 [Streptosporangium lutulentum]